MLYSMGKVMNVVNIGTQALQPNESYKPVSLLKSLDKDMCCFSGINKLNNVNNVVFCGKDLITPHDNPYVLVHGTLAKEDTLFKLRDFLKSKVHSIDLTSYPMITKGDPIQVSAQVVSKNINKSRIAI